MIILRKHVQKGKLLHSLNLVSGDSIISSQYFDMSKFGQNVELMSSEMYFYLKNEITASKVQAGTSMNLGLLLTTKSNAYWMSHNFKKQFKVEYKPGVNDKYRLKLSYDSFMFIPKDSIFTIILGQVISDKGKGMSIFDSPVKGSVFYQSGRELFLGQRTPKGFNLKSSTTIKFKEKE